ncbi:protein CDV3 homolog [Nomia melanderi]|uniref:protein CDV3 homolog n=1 Tax=Nomia melanderi TaxID=2448451 RepID=UPI001303FECA|nr:protein CDV3 homolog [Nomia melanderi]
MADLDDFFAKKDRKKAKGKKFTTTEEIAKKLEETGKRLGKSKTKDKPVNPEVEETQQTEDEDEWREFEEEKKDYTGLKIGNLTLNESVDAESDDEKGTGDNSSDGESGEGGGKQLGPWKKPELPPQPVEVVEPTPPPPPAVTSGSSYKPPHLRNIQPVAASPRPRGKNIAPDIHSEEYFPTLNSKQQQKRDDGAFEEVRNKGGTRSSYVPEQTQTPKLMLSNKYGALSQDQS